MMADSTTTAADEVLRQQINRIIRRYPPLVNDRRHFTIEVADGVVTLRGHVGSQSSQTYLVGRISEIAGVRQLVVDDLHNDDALRLEAGAVSTAGVLVNVEYGTVVLSGRLPDDLSVEELARRIGALPGVRRVIAHFPDMA